MNLRYVMMTLTGFAMFQNSHAATVLGRCHMDNCWWMNVQHKTLIKQEGDARLYRFEKRTTSAEFNNQPYPKTMPKALEHSWNKHPEINYVLCSDKLPVYIEANKKGYTAHIPFDLIGQPSGATEGVTNLYNYICYGIHDGKEAPKHRYYFKSEQEQCREIQLKKPEAIFDFMKTCKK